MTAPVAGATLGSERSRSTQSNRSPRGWHERTSRRQGRPRRRGRARIGAGIAERFHEEGARLMIADREAAAGKTTAERLEGAFVATDIAKPADAERAVATALATYGDLHIVVQNAGIFPWSLIENITPEEWDAVLGVNLRGAFLIARAALPHMKAKRYGRFVFTSSITGPRVTSPGHGHYSASKAGINGFIKAAALEFSACDITVNGVEPGNILTEGLQQNRSETFIRSMEEAIPLGRLGTPRDVAQAALSSLPTRRPTSPARQSWSTAGRPCLKARTSGWRRDDWPVASWRRAKASRAFFEQLAPDQHAPDLARAGADLIELGVAQQAPERIVVGVAVAA